MVVDCDWWTLVHLVCLDGFNKFNAGHLTLKVAVIVRWPIKWEIIQQEKKHTHV